MTLTLARLFAATLGLVVAQAAISPLAPAAAHEEVVSLPLAVTSMLLIVSVLMLVAAHGRVRRPMLALLLFGVWGSIQVNYLLETVIFDIGIPRPDRPWLFVHALCAAAAAGLVVAAFAPAPVSGNGGRRPVRLGRLVLTLIGCGLVYLLLYIASGLVIAWPYTSSHYAQWPLPSPLLIFPAQIVRGAGFALTVWLIVRYTRSDRLMSGMIAGLVLCVLGGVAPLLLPNAYMPGLVRLAHLAEILVSNFPFGVIAAWWLWPLEEGQQA